MATTAESMKNDEGIRTIGAPVLESVRVPPAAREGIVHPDPAPLHEIPKDIGAEAGLAQVEALLGQGRFGAALREVGALPPPGDAALAGRYAFIRHEKLSRAQIGIAERYVLRGDRENARRFYELALQPPGAADLAVKGVAELAGKAFDDLMARRSELIRGLKDDIGQDRFSEWCGRKKTLTGLTILDLGLVRGKILPDFRLEDVFGERPPIHPDPGYLDPLPAETESVGFPSAMPGSVFRAVTDAPVGVSAAPVGSPAAADTRIRASLAFPVVANVLRAKAGLFALDQSLSVTGQADGTVPLFRYEYLRDKAKELITHIQGIELRMLPIQFSLDDFAEIVDAIRRPLAAQQAELEAVKQRIGELTQDLAALAQVEQALDTVVIALDKAEADCDCDWFCWVATFVSGAFVEAVLLAAAIALTPATFGASAVLGGILGSILAGSAGAATGILVYQTFTCENITTVGGSMKASLAGVRGAITENEAELQHALATRDILIAQINALSDQLSEVYQSNAARTLDAKTLDAIQAQYNMLRQSLLARAQSVAKLAQNAFNFERDSEANLIRDAYDDPGRKGYTAAETLLHDLNGLDYIDLTGRMRKAVQLSHMISLRKHHPVSFIAVAATGGGRFTTALQDFDRWYPGTYLQRIKEVRVEVLVDGEVAPVRGYLSNDGVLACPVLRPGQQASGG